MKFYLLAIVTVLIANSIVNALSLKLTHRSRVNRHQGSPAGRLHRPANIDLGDLFLASSGADNEDLINPDFVSLAQEQPKKPSSSRLQPVDAFVEQDQEEETDEDEENEQQQAATAALIEDYLESMARSSPAAAAASSSSSRNVYDANEKDDYEAAYLANLLNKAASLDVGGGVGGHDHDDDKSQNVGGGDDEEELEMHSSLIGGHQYVSGGAGEGKQHLKPDGAVENKEEIKSDEDLPAYCDPPNPCPIGVSSDDCDPRPFAEFSAEYSKMFQEQQNCMCDDDHNECHKSNKMKSNDFLNGHNDKFTQVVAKKSPDVKRQSASDQNETKHKRFLTGEAINVAQLAKKSSTFM